ncbi:hypothetical protein CFP56_017968 [Quercus suber]|uniref:Uncharacterized protein n=1 Tax=Quercus suber TaxID=58331 RepID=A0AAW0KJV5_QUESU
MVLGLRRMASKWICVLRSHNVAGLGLGLDRTAWIGLFGSDCADGTGFGTGSDCVDRTNFHTRKEKIFTILHKVYCAKV